MVRTKAGPTEASPPDAGGEKNSLATPAPHAPTATPLPLRVRGPTGVLTLSGLTSASTLGDLRAAAEGALGGALSHASFRGDDGRPVALLSDGAWPAGGALLVGPDTRCSTLGLDPRGIPTDSRVPST